jgi:hypothetical protein
MRTRLGSLLDTLAPGPRPGARPLALLLALLLAGLLFLSAAPQVLAHGVEMTAGTGQEAAWIRAGYAGGDPMEFARVRVIDPQGRTHQVGNADSQGRFAWLADQEGEWMVVAEDGMGHRGEVAVKAGATAVSSPAPVQMESASPPRWLKTLLGLSFIFWLSGLVFWQKARQARSRGRQPR